MKVLSVGRTQKKELSEFVPKEILQQNEMDGFFCVGLYDDQANMKPVGMLQFYAGFKEEDQPTLTITWLYIREEARFQGGGASLLDKVKEIAKGSGTNRILAYLPLKESKDDACQEDSDEEASGEKAVPSDRELLKSCLSKQGFVFRSSSRFFLEQPIADYPKRTYAGEDERTHIRRLKDLNRTQWNSLLKRVNPGIGAGLRQFHGGKSSLGIDPDISCIYEKENTILGFMLVRMLPSKVLDIVRIRSLQGGNSAPLLGLTQYLKEAGERKYPKDQILRISTRNESAIRLLQKLFPETELLTEETGCLMLGK